MATKNHSRPEKRATAGEMGGRLSSQSLVYAAVAVDYFAVGMMRTLMPFYSQQLGGSPLTQGALEALYGAGQVLGSLGLGRYSDARGRKAGLAVSFGGSAVGYAMVCVSMSGAAGRHALSLLLLSRVPVSATRRKRRRGHLPLCPASEGPQTRPLSAHLLPDRSGACHCSQVGLAKQTITLSRAGACPRALHPSAAPHRLTATPPICSPRAPARPDSPPSPRRRDAAQLALRGHAAPLLSNGCRIYCRPTCGRLPRAGALARRALLRRGRRGSAGGVVAAARHRRMPDVRGAAAARPAAAARDQPRARQEPRAAARCSRRLRARRGAHASGRGGRRAARAPAPAAPHLRAVAARVRLRCVHRHSARRDRARRRLEPAAPRRVQQRVGGGR